LLKKSVLLLIALLVFSFSLSGFAFAKDNVATTFHFNESVQQQFLIKSRLNSIFSTYYRPGLVSGYIYDIQVTLRDFTGDGTYEIAVISYSITGEKHLDIFSGYGRNMVRIFSGKGDSIELNNNGFSISNVKYDGRYYNETYTYKWGNGKFLRTGYSKTYIKNDYTRWPIKEKPDRISKDERVRTVSSLLSARMQGDFDNAMNFLSQSYKKDVSSKELRKLIPYGQVTTVDIFESQRGDWVVAVIRDYSGQSRVFKFVPVEESNEYGNIKIEQIVEIPRAN
jgi:hypothetical protein